MLHGHSLLAWAPLLLSCSRVLCKNLHSFAGPYIAFAHRIDVCPSDGSFVIHLRNSHFNRAKPYEKQSIWGNASGTMPFDDSEWIHVNFAIRSNNQWKENAFIFDFPGGACSALREHIPSIFQLMAKYVPELSGKRAPCRVPPGQYKIHNQSMSWDFPNFKVMAYGRYRVTITLGKTTKTVRFCMEIASEVIPRPS